MRISKYASSPDTKKKVGTGEIAAGAVIGGAGVSNRVPAVVNSSYQWNAKRKLKGFNEKVGNARGLTAEGEPVNPNTLSRKAETVGTRAEKIKQDARIAAPEFQNMTQPEKRKVYQEVHRTWQAHKKGEGPRPQEVDIERTVNVKESPRNAALKRLTSQKQKLNFNTTRKIMKPSARWQTAAVVGGGALAYHGMRQRAEPVKKADKRDVDAAAIGAAGSAAAYTLVPNKIESHLRRTKWEPKTKASPKLSRIAHDHQVVQGVKHHPDQGKGHPNIDSKKWSMIPAGERKWIQYNRSLPSELPGALTRRTMSYTHAGKTGIAATGAVAAAGGYGALKLDRKRRKKQ